jgi:hypothetical protein
MATAVITSTLPPSTKSTTIATARFNVASVPIVFIRS